MSDTPAIEHVGIRDLKAHLSRHLKKVRAGACLVVTDRGKSVAVINPVDAGDDFDWARQLVAEGRAQWDSGKPAGCRRPVDVAPGQTVSSAVLEDRR